jgi:hypothetical protein
MENVLNCLTVKPNGAVLWTVGKYGQMRYAGVIPTPRLYGEPGPFYGYGPGGWLYSYGLPNDMKPVKCIVLYRGPTKVGQMWFYQSQSVREAKAIFVFRSMRKGTDPQGRYPGHHDFCWYRVTSLDHEAREETDET